MTARAKADGGLRPMFMQNLKIGCQWTAIETWQIAAGVPDAEYCFQGGAQGWLECKQTKAWAVKIQPLQVAWLDRRHRLGGRCFMAIRRVAGNHDQLWLIRGNAVTSVATYGLSSVQDTAWIWEGGPKLWDWKEIRETLQS